MGKDLVDDRALGDERMHLDEFGEHPGDTFDDDFVRAPLGLANERELETNVQHRRGVQNDAQRRALKSLAFATNSMPS